MSYAEYLAAIGPEIALTIAALLVMSIDALWPRSVRAIPWIGIAGLLVTLAMLPMFRAERVAFSGLLVIDPLAVLFKVIALISVILVALLSISHRPLRGFHEGEYHTLLLFFAVGLMFLVGAAHLLMIYLALEMVSLAAYLLTGHLKLDPRSSEAALKYYLFGALCSGLFLYGASILFGLTGTLHLDGIAEAVRASGLSAALLAALVLMLIGLGFKIAMVPFHLWAPDAYEGAPTPITALLSVASKAGGFAVLLRVLAVAFPLEALDWQPMLWVLCVVTMSLGNVIAVRQGNIKRLLAYSSIAQAGYVLVGVVLMRQTPAGLPSAMIYLIAYLFMNIGAFAVVIVVSNALGSDKIEDYRGLARRAPLASASLAVFLVSLTGIPPLAGFIGKFYLFAATIDAHAYWLAVIMGVNSVVAAFYYFRVVRAMYLDAGKSEEPIGTARPLQVAVGVTLLGTFVIGVWPQPFLLFAAALPLGF
ncbi:NADH-quinone oxidoreductase subunit N [Candidatus Sumerlaeota bacterium]|nr:NADH-quinone oxidoreductase subunit N [Candidatus Sumerlaeota bacterium]